MSEKAEKLTELIPHTSEILHRMCKPFDFRSEDASSLANELLTIKNGKKAYGLAAPQIGVDARAFVYLETAVFNPEIVEMSSDTLLFNEGCLSYPGLWASVKRSEAILVNYHNINGEFIEGKELQGLEARIFLHEFDHLSGIVMTDRISNLKLKRAIEKAVKDGYNYSYKELRRI